MRPPAWWKARHQIRRKWHDCVRNLFDREGQLSIRCAIGDQGTFRFTGFVRFTFPSSFTCEASIAPTNSVNGGLSRPPSEMVKVFDHRNARFLYAVCDGAGADYPSSYWLLFSELSVSCASTSCLGPLNSDTSMCGDRPHAFVSLCGLLARCILETATGKRSVMPSVLNVGAEGSFFVPHIRNKPLSRANGAVPSGLL
jgi:hypothetical protein